MVKGHSARFSEGRQACARAPGSARDHDDTVLGIFYGPGQAALTVWNGEEIAVVLHMGATLMAFRGPNDGRLALDAHMPRVQERERGQFELLNMPFAHASVAAIGHADGTDAVR